ncbi:MAG: hypothetical protein F4Y38_16385 [Gemmatimonadetes bacterium]|nr:hypothetical protein [Gemmatimonadota bacterium]MYG86123.1 hypothetical protein [Gemmatimonadota bacterium]MYJ90377.1 hypothetical protein [Gemmatimonadota bacterium]
MGLDFSFLPDLPQVETLKRVAPEIWSNEEVRAFWIEGSFGQGTADRYSDVDLRLAVPAARFRKWQTPDFTALFKDLCFAHQRLFPQEEAILHHVLLETGEMYDLGIQRIDRLALHGTSRLLGCRDPALAESFTEPVTVSAAVSPGSPDTDPDPGTVGQLIVDFWINSNKHRKVLYRGLDPMVVVGLQTERAILIRLWAIHASGRDTGKETPTIHTLTPQVRSIGITGRNALEVLGAPVRNRNELKALIERHRDEVARVGRSLAERYAFGYPEVVEATVRAGWDEFLSTV